MNVKSTRTMERITSVLVANRGEIARRIFATCRAMGISTVAVFSDPDETASFVYEADLSVRLPGQNSADTYLRSDLILEAAKKTGAQAIHPGYGFLSENADFAKCVIDAGLVWIGPSPEAIMAMGSKVHSKELMKAAGVPVLDNMKLAEVTQSDLPLLVKASAGGGGRGMRIVENLEQLKDIADTAAREAQSAFGDPTVFIERYIPASHHIEVQILGDTYGNIWIVGERECSIQRRHQKIVEEAPAPLVERIGSEMRERLFRAARDAAGRIGYVGAGTVEFLANDQGDFFFLEMNTRLQVEHPVTESVTGLDLVALQIYVAQGGELVGNPPQQTGHSIEVRLYAEDPAQQWQPQSGPVRRFVMSGVDERFQSDVARQQVEAGGCALRLDAAFEEGLSYARGGEHTVSPFYDSMIAKVIATAPTRELAANHLAESLATLDWDGPSINRDLLVQVLRSEDFITGRTDTSFLERNPDVFESVISKDELHIAAVAAAVGLAARVESGQPTTASGVIADANLVSTGEESLALAIQSANPKPQIGRFRLFADLPTIRTFVGDTGAKALVALRRERQTWVIEQPRTDVAVVIATPEVVVLDINGIRRRFVVSADGRRVTVKWAHAAVTLVESPRFTDPSTAIAPGSLIAPLPGTVVRVAVGVGDRVEAGQPMLWMEAMKMEHTVFADTTGTVRELSVRVGDQLEAGALVAVIGDDDV